MPSQVGLGKRVKLSKLAQSGHDDVYEYEQEYENVKYLSTLKGNTLRRTIFYGGIQNNPILTRYGGFSSSNKETYGLLPVTEIDFFFDRGMVEANCHNRERPIKEELQTSKIVEKLEKLAINKESSFSRRTGLLQSVFDIPICGHYMPLTLDQLQEEGNGDDLIFAGSQDFIPNETKRSRKSYGNNKLHEEWRLNGGKTTKKKNNSLSENSEGKMDKTRWLYYQGKYWDPSLLYVFHPTLDDHCETRTRSLGVLHKLCPLHHTEAYRARVQLGPVLVDTVNGDGAAQQKKTLTAAMVRKQYEKIQQTAEEVLTNKESDAVLNRLLVKSFSDRSNPRGMYAHHYYSNKKKSNSKAKHMEIDLGEVCMLSHIGFLGGYPHFSEISIFPPSFKFEKHAFQLGSSSYQQRLQQRIMLGIRTGASGPKGRSRRRLRRGRSRQVQIVSESSLCWVERFKLQYRDIVTRKWCDWPNDLEGNTDIVNEVRHKLSLQTRFLRVIPREYHNHRDFTVLLYGKPMENHHVDSVRHKSLHNGLKPNKKEQKRIKRSLNDAEKDETESDNEEEEDTEYEDIEEDEEEPIVEELQSNDEKESRMKKPLNLSMCYEAIHNYQETEKLANSNMEEYRKVASRQTHYSTQASSRRKNIRHIRNILGKKVETIRYMLSYHVSHAYNAEEILLRSDSDEESTSPENIEKYRKPGLHLAGRYARLPEGQTYGFYRDSYGELSPWQVRDNLKKNMMEDFNFSRYNTENEY